MAKSIIHPTRDSRRWRRDAMKSYLGKEGSASVTLLFLAIAGLSLLVLLSIILYHATPPEVVSHQ